MSGKTENIHNLIDKIPSDVSIEHLTHRAYGLIMYPLNKQNIQGKIEIKRGTVGIISNDPSDYISNYCKYKKEIPSTYSNWDEEISEEIEEFNEPVISGLTGKANNNEEYRKFYYKSSNIRAGVRILSGGGRFSSEDFTLHIGVPYALLEHNNGILLFSPLDQRLTEEFDTIDFTYNKTGEENFSLV